MKDQLHAILADLVEQYGRDKVTEALREIKSKKKRVRVLRKREKTDDSILESGAEDRKKPSSIPTAVRYASKLDIDSERSREITMLAERFDRKTFLPNFGEIRNFCEIYGLKEPSSKSRVSAIPVLFRFLKTLDSVDLRKLLFESAYSGPSELGPIADAIRGNSKQRNYRLAFASDKSASNSAPKEKQKLTDISNKND